MKLNIFIIAACLIFSACSKEQQVATPGTNPNAYKSDINPCGNWPPQHLVTQFPYIWSEPFCTYPCMNCFYPVTIVASSTRQSEVYGSFLSHYGNNSLGDFFINEEWSLIFPDLTSEIITKYLNGEYKIVLKDSADDDVQLVIVMLVNGVVDPMSEQDAVVVYQLKTIHE